MIIVHKVERFVIPSQMIGHILSLALQYLQEKQEGFNKTLSGLLGYMQTLRKVDTLHMMTIHQKMPA